VKQEDKEEKKEDDGTFTTALARERGSALPANASSVVRGR
jgi:hypothetical protein